MTIRTTCTLLAAFLLLGCSKPDDSKDTGMDDSGAPDDVLESADSSLPDGCYRYSNDEAACTAAGCNMYKGGARFCIDDEGRCIYDDPFTVCGAVRSDEYGFSGVRVSYFVMDDSGEPIVAEFDLLQGELKEWKTCDDPAYGMEATPRPDAPPACKCRNGEYQPGDCPEIE